MRLIKRRALGNTGEQVTEISLGAMNLRTLNTEQEGVAVIHKALDLGINLIDTARAYVEEKSDGRLIESEILVKTAITEHEDIGEAIIIVTKGHGYEPKQFDIDLKISLEKMGVEGENDLTIGGRAVKIAYFFHGLSQERWETMVSSGVLEHAKKLKEKGLFTYLGFSSHNGHEECIEAAIKSGYFQVIELPYSVFAPGLDGLIKLAHDRGIGVINMKAFGGTGMITKTKMFEDYCDISTEKRLQFCLSNEYISTVDAGCRFIDELVSDVEVSFAHVLSNAECDGLVDSAKRVAQITSNTCRECTHCLEKFECPQGLNFPSVLAIHTRLKIAQEFDGDITSIRQTYANLKNEADKCISCGLCNEWCEYKLDIPTLLDEAREVLG